MKYGVGVTLICAAVWVLIESILCPLDHYRLGFKVMGYIPGHAVWHIGMSYGLALVALWFITMESVLQKNRYFAFKTVEERIIKCPGDSDSRCNRCLDCVFPVITNNRNIEHFLAENDSNEHLLADNGDQTSAEL